LDSRLVVHDRPLKFSKHHLDIFKTEIISSFTKSDEEEEEEEEERRNLET